MLGLLTLVALAFAFHPVVERDRILVPQELYVGQACDCDCIRDKRPWYSTINSWFWLAVTGWVICDIA